MQASLFGSIRADVSWSHTEMVCESMLRPNGDGIRLRFSGDVSGERLAIIIALPDLLAGESASEIRSNVTASVEGSGRFFSTPNLDSCWTDIDAQMLLDDDKYAITGTLYCVAPLGELNGDAAISIPELWFSGIVDWGTPATARNAAVVKELERRFKRDTLIIEADDGRRHGFDIYLATDFEQQRRGLMFVRSMPANTGMLFVYEQADKRSMWMKNTYISLDLIFARSDGTVATVIHGTEPLSLTPRGSSEPVSFVLELNAGTARRLNIGRNSRIIWRQDAAR